MEAKAIYLLPVWDTITRAWEKVKGTKGSIWAAILIFLLISIAFSLLIPLAEKYYLLQSFLGFASSVFNFLMQLGLLYMGIKRAYDSPLIYTQVFRAFNLSIIVNLILLYIIKFFIYLPFVIIFFGLAIFYYSPETLISSILLSILIATLFFYLVIRLMFAVYFILDKERLAPWQAIKLSYAATRGNFWRILALIICQIGIFILALLPLGIGLIWAIPLNLIAAGLIYRQLLANIPNKL